MTHAARSAFGSRGGAGAYADETSQGRAARILTLVTGLVFLAVGIIGFDDFFGHHTGDQLLGFELNGFHNVVHLAFGVLGVVMWRSYRTARAYGLLLVVAYAVVLAFGIAAVGETWNVLSINTADNWLHLGFIVVGAVIAGLAHKAAQEAHRGRDRAAA